MKIVVMIVDVIFCDVFKFLLSSWWFEKFDIDVVFNIYVLLV